MIATWCTSFATLLALLSSSDSLAKAPSPDATILDLDGDLVLDAVEVVDGRRVVRCGLTESVLASTPEAFSAAQDRATPVVSPTSEFLGLEREALALVPNIFSDDVSLVDLNSLTEVARIPVGDGARYATMSGDGRYAYLSADALGDNTGVWVIDLEARRLIDLIVVPGFLGGQTFLSPDDRWLLVGGSSPVNQWGRLMAVDTRSRSVAWQLDFGSEGWAGAVAFSADGSCTTFLDETGPTVYTVELETGELVQRFPFSAVSAFAGASQIQFLADRPVGVTVWAGQGPPVPFGWLAPETRGFPIGLLDLSVAVHDMELILGDRAVAFGNVSYGPGIALQLLDLEDGTITSMSGPAPVSWLSVHPNGREVWGMTPATSLGSGWFHELDLGTGTLVSIPADVSFCVPNLSLDGRLFLATYFLEDRMVAIDTQTHQMFSVPVGDNPRGVYVQGLNRVP